MPDVDLVVTGSGEVRDADGNLLNQPEPDAEAQPGDTKES